MEVKPGYKQTEVGVIPVEWNQVSLKAISSQITDGDHVTPNRARDGYYLLSARNVRDGFLDLSDVDFVGASEFKRMRNRCAPEAGDLLISCSGHGLGRVAIVPNGLHCVLVRSAALVKLDQMKADSLFVQYWLQGANARKQISDSLSRAAQPNLFLNSIERLSSPLPPRAEQRAIAEALSDVDGLLGGLERLIAKKRDIKQAAMQQLLTGETRLPGFHGKWELKRLGDVVDTDPENLGSETRPDFFFNYVALEDVDRGFLRSHSEQCFGTAPSRARRKLCANDVLVSTVRPNLQSHLLFNGEPGRWVCSTGFCVLRCREGVTNHGYVFFHFFAGCVNRQIDSLLTGSNYPAINSADVRALQIPFPSVPEQTAIAAVLTDMDAELAALEQRREKTRALKQAMMQELLTGRTRLL
jgi:type I restriction enzyme, S subunit